MSGVSSPKLAGAALEQAARLHARLKEGGARRDVLAAEAFIRESDLNRICFEKVETLWRQAAEDAGDPGILALRAEARSRAERKGERREQLLAASLAAILVLGSAWIAVGPVPFAETGARAPRPAQFSTLVGEQRIISLSDGSKVTLNTATQLEVRYSRGARELLLAGGEAYFEVAKDKARPFRVQAADRSIVAYGTAFDVRVDGQTLRVALLEGRVGVSKAGQVVQLSPKQLLIADKGVEIRAIEDPAAVTSWSRGFVEFDNQTVSEAVAEMNRYVATPIVVTDPSLARMRISGTFRVGEVDAFVEALGYYTPAVARRDASGRILLSRG